MLDGETFGNEVVALVRGYVEREFAPLKAENAELKERLAALEARPAPEKGEPGDDGKSIEPADVQDLIAEEVAKAVAAIPVPKNGDDGKDAAGIVEALKDSGELVLTLQDGRLIRTGIRDGEKGKDAEPEDDWGSELTVEEKSGMLSSMIRKELGDDELIILPDPITVPSRERQADAVVIHNHLPKRGIEKTVVTKYDERGRIAEYERREA